MSSRRNQSRARVMVVDEDRRYGEWLRHHLDVLCPQASVSMLDRSEFERWCSNFSLPRQMLRRAIGSEWR